MNTVQQIIYDAINRIEAIPKAEHRPEWRNSVIKDLKKQAAIAALVLNPDHPNNQPLPEEPR